MNCLWFELEYQVILSDCYDCCDCNRTIKPAETYDATEDADALRQAMKGFGTSEQVLIDVLTKRSNDQRQLICAAYQEANGSTLVEDLKGETRGHFEDALVALVTPPAIYDCHEVMRAFKGFGTRENILVEILASRSNEQIQALREAFQQETGQSLSEALEKEVKGEFQRALLLLVQGNRDGTFTMDTQLAKQDAEALHQAGQQEDKSALVDVLCGRNFLQLRKVLAEYSAIAGKSMQEFLESEMSGHLQELLLAIVKCVKSVPTYFAEQLHDSMKGLGTDECSLNRIIVSRSEIDLLDIKTQFKKRYDCTLQSFLESDLSGSHRDLMLAICGREDEA